MSAEPSPDPGSPRVRFGAEMRRLREAAQLSQAAVAARLGCTQTQVSRLEAATRTPSKSDAERLDRLFGRPTAALLRRLYQRIVARPGRPGLVHELGRGDRAHRPRPPLLGSPPRPGLLQTESYARHVFCHGPRITPEEVEERVQARMRRQRILDKDDPPLLLALIDAGVLRRKVGGPEVMREQLDHLLEIASAARRLHPGRRPGMPAGMLGAFMIAELPDGQPDTIHVDSSAEGQVTTDRDLVTSIWNRYEAIRLWAYPEHISLKMIEEARQEWT